MKRLALLAGLLMIIIQVGIAQDLIITTTNDTIQCRITKIEADFYHFTLKYGEEYRNTLISINDVKKVERNLEGAELIPEEMMSNSNSSSLHGYFSGGWGHRTAKISSDFSSDQREYLEELMNGYNLEGGIHYYISDAIGYGLSFSSFRAQNEIATFDISNDMTITYVGPSIQTRLDGLSEDLYFITSTSLGYLKYHDDLRDGGDILIESSTLGLKFDLKMGVPISEKYGMLIGATYLQGVLSDFTLSANGQTETIELDKENYEGLNRIDLNIGFYLTK